MTGEQNVPMRVEDEIDAALKMLGETRPPAEIVSRVHHRLDAAIISQRLKIKPTVSDPGCRRSDGGCDSSRDLYPNVSRPSKSSIGY